MKKKVFACVLALVMAAGSVPAAGLAGFAPAQTEVMAAKKKTPTVSQLQKAVEEAYGDDYAATEKLSKDEIRERFGITSSLYTSASAYMSLMSTQVDTLVIVKAKDAKSKKKVKSKLTKYRKSLIEDTMQYPMNVYKIQASRVYTKGNYVFFIMLGFIDHKTEENGTDEDLVKAFKKQNQKAVDAVNALF